MIHIAIYDRNPAVGLELGDVSPGFPEEYRSHIQQISEAFGTPEDSDIHQQDALRYTPLGDRYLLSFIQRMRDSRRYNRIVHYLMDRREAEAMLRCDLRALMARLKQEAGNSAQVQQEILCRDGWTDELPVPGNQTPNEALRHALYAGAFLPDSTKKVRLVLPEGEELSLQLMGWLLSQLPPALRLQVRFNTNVSIPPEGNGCCLLFCSPEANQLFERGVSGGELADVCVFSLRDGCDQSLLRQEFEFVLPLLEASAASRRNAQILFGEEGDWDKYLALLQIPYQSARTELKEIAALCGSAAAADHLDKLGYPPVQLEILARNAPGWLREDQILYQAVQKYGPAPKIRRSVHSEPDASRDVPGSTPGDHTPAEPVHVSPKRKRPAPRGPGAAIVLLLCAVVIVLFAVSVKLILGALTVADRTVTLMIAEDAYHYLLRSAALAVSCTALGAALTVLLQQLYRLLRPRRRGRRS